MTDLSDAYRNAAHIPGGAAWPARWAAAAAAFRAGRPGMTEVAWSVGARQRFDLFTPDRPAKGTVVFVHGGYWRAFGPGDFSHLAAGPLAQGWAVAMPGYDLCPAVRIATITRQVATAIDAIAATSPGPLHLIGHSAGGHLVARMACPDVSPRASARIARIVTVSPLSNLAPLMATDLNADLHLDPAEAAAESPLLHPRPATDVRVWVGGAERPAFLDQAGWLARAWACPLTIEEGRHHFDVIEGLADPHSRLTAALLG